MLWWRGRGIVGQMRLALAVVMAMSLIRFSAAALPADKTWASPVAPTLRSIGANDPEQTEPGFLYNLDCRRLTFRLRDSNQMRTGCFTPTAFGLLDGDTDIAIFNGTDEGQLLLPYGPHQAFVPWPSAGLISLVPDAIQGDYLGLYRNPLMVLRDEYLPASPLLANRVTAQPDLIMTDPVGRPLLINAQTMAFSDGGSWLVAEDLRGSFVRINLATLDMLPFAPAFGTLGSPGLLQSQVAISPDGRFVAIANQAASSFKLYDLATCTHSRTGLEPENCQSHDYQPFISHEVKGFLTARHLRFVNDYLISFEAELGDGQRHGRYTLAPDATAGDSINYLALGDSYTAGEGAFDYLAGTDTPDNRCHSSVYAYPELLAQDLFGTAGGHSVACSGAVINDVSSGSLDYRGQARGSPAWRQLKAEPSSLSTILAGFRPGYIAQRRFPEAYQPRIVTVSVGGNDIGFGDILKICVTPHLSLRTDGNTCYSSYEDRVELLNLIDRTVPRWTSLFQQLRAIDPAGQLYVVDYPGIVAATGSCADNVRLNLSERQFAGQLVNYLDAAIQQAAQAAGAASVDISQALSGHRLCEATGSAVAVNGLTAGTDGGPFGLRVFGSESYHPNSLGYRLIEQAILRQVNNFGGRGGRSADQIAATLLDAPKTGRAIYHLVPADGMGPDQALPGEMINITVDGLADGLRPRQRYAVKLDRMNNLMNLISDDTGSLTGSVLIPADTELGSHSLDIIGQNQAGQTVDVRKPIYLTDVEMTGFNPSASDRMTTLVGTNFAKLPSNQVAHQAQTHSTTPQTDKPPAAHGARPAQFEWRWAWLAVGGLWTLILLSGLAWRLLQ